MNYLSAKIGILIVLVLLSIGLFIGYLNTKNMVGENAAKQGVKVAFFSLLIGMCIFLPFYFLKDNLNTLGIFQIVLSIITILYLIFYYVRDKSFMGHSIRSLSSSRQFKLLFWFGIYRLVTGGFGLISNVSSVLNRSQNNLDVVSKIGASLFDTVLGIALVHFSTRKTQVFENGISVIGAFIQWEKITEYRFEAIRQNTLRAKYKHDIPFIPGYFNLALSEQDKTDLQQIFQSKLPNLEQKS
jgi:hypothetical protein